jgi:hypothetical protein
MIPLISKEEVLERLWSNTTTNDKGCRLWHGNKINGYGQISIKDKMFYVHRLSAWIYHGLDLENKRELALHKDDLCISKNCWAPDHLYKGDHCDNTHDRAKKGDSNFFGAHNWEKTHCPQGHEFTEENTYLQKGTKVCRICKAKRVKEFRERNRKLRTKV